MTKPSKKKRAEPKAPELKAPAFATFLNTAMDTSGLSFSGLARRVKALGVSVSPSELWQIIRGYRDAPSAPVCYVLARVLKLDPVLLIEVLLWSRANPTEGAVPDVFSALGGTMLVSGLEEDFVMRFRKLTAAQSRDVIQHLSFIEGQAGKEGARSKRETFRQRRSSSGGTAS